MEDIDEIVWMYVFSFYCYQSMREKYLTDTTKYYVKC